VAHFSLVLASIYLANLPVEEETRIRFMDLLDRIVHGFIMTFGITQPKPERRRVADLFIGFLLLSVLVGFLLIVFFGVRQLAR